MSAPCGVGTALSWSFTALRGHSPDSARTAFGPVRPARRFDALRVFAEAVLPCQLSLDGGPPCASALLQRSITAPPHRPAGPKTGTSDDASSPGLSCPSTHPGLADPFSAERPAPQRVASEVSVPPSRRTPPSLPRLATSERPWASPFKAFSSSRWVSLSGSLPSCRSSRRFAAPPWGAGGRERLQGLLPGSSSFCARFPEGTRGVDAFLGFSRPELSPPPSRLSAFNRGASPRTHSSGVTSTSACVTGSLGTEGSACPSRDCRLSSGLSPYDCRGAAALGVKGGLMVSPHSSGALQAARTDLCPLPTEPTEV